MNGRVANYARRFGHPVAFKASDATAGGKSVTSEKCHDFLESLTRILAIKRGFTSESRGDFNERLELSFEARPFLRSRRTRALSPLTTEKENRHAYAHRCDCTCSKMRILT